MKNVIFETERTMVRRFELADVNDALGWMGNSSVIQFDDWEIMDHEEITEFIKEQHDIPLNSADILNEYAIALKETGKVIGGLSFHLNDQEERWASFGYHFNPAFQRKGFGEEIARALMSHLFSLEIDIAFAKVDPRNVPSCLLLEKIGFKLKEVLKNSCYVHGELADEAVYILKRKDWPGNNGKK